MSVIVCPECKPVMKQIGKGPGETAGTGGSWEGRQLAEL